MLKPQYGLFAFGVLLVLVGVLLPQGWYDALPRNPEIPTPPIKGITLLQISLVIEGLILMVFSFLRWKFTPMDRNMLLATPKENANEHIQPQTAMWILGAITLLALTLRLIRLNTDLWLDEIFTVTFYSRLSFAEIVATYVNFNNHLLNTLMVKVSISIFGENEWTIRIPAVIFGTAAIPAMYWVARQLGLSRIASLGVALILAVSYHHIFFSQNARGYIGNVFFTLLASGLLVRALQTDSKKHWSLYVVAMLLNFASLLVSAFVLIAHSLVALIALFVVGRRGVNVMPLLRRLVVVFGLTGLLSFQLYSLILPSAYARSQVSYSGEGDSGYFSLFSLDFLTELLRGLSVAIGLGDSPLAMLILIAGVAVVGIGFVALLRRNWTLTLALSSPGFLYIAFLVVSGLTFSPRVFLPVLPIAFISAIQGVHTSAEFVGKMLPKNLNLSILLPRVATALAVFVLVAISVLSLRTYYSVPKQPYQASLEYLGTELQPNEIILVVDLAEQGYRYYGENHGFQENQDYFIIKTVEDLDTVLSQHGEKDTVVVTTLTRFLHSRKPDLGARIEEDWKIVRTFPASIGNGQISVWSQSQ